MSKDALRNLVRKAIDLHVHIGPEVIPRKFNSVDKLIQAEKGKIAGLALKNHFYPTQPLISTAKSDKAIKLFGGLVLNNFQGGLNPEAVYANALLSAAPTIVWFPTVNAEHFLNESSFEIPNEWVQRKNFIARKSSSINPVRIDTKLSAVLDAISKNDAILATGHISWQETRKVITEAARKNISRLVVTHPIYQRIDFPISEQKKLTRLGAKMEHCYSMYSIDAIPISRIAAQIKAVGAKNCILSSDVGQTFSPTPSEALAIFSELLLNEGVSLKELSLMMVTNPTELTAVRKK